MGSINQINNENEKYALHFIFHTNILHIKFSWIHVKNIYIKITYQLVRRQETGYNIIYQKEKYIKVYIDDLIEEMCE